MNPIALADIEALIVSINTRLAEIVVEKAPIEAQMSTLHEARGLLNSEEAVLTQQLSDAKTSMYAFFAETMLANPGSGSYVALAALMDALAQA